MSIKELQEKLVGIIADLAIEGDDSKIEKTTKEAIDTINELKDHINDDIEHNNETMTALDLVIRFDSHGYDINGHPKRINNKALLEVEKAIRDAKGETSEDLGRNSTPSTPPSTNLENVIIELVQRPQRQMVASID